MENEVIHGDCIEEMKEMEENSVDAVVTDPPYGLAFMGKDWDDFKPKEFQQFCQEWGEQALRVLKSGGHLLAFCGTRTYHRMVVGLEDVGFEIRDQIAWMYGSGFPKGHNISKAIDDYFDKESEVVGVKKNDQPAETETYSGFEGQGNDNNTRDTEITAPATSEAERWQGWNTSLKPGHEPIVVAQKPKEGTYAENVLEYGVGGLNIDGCRIEHKSKEDFENAKCTRSQGEKRSKGKLYNPIDMEKKFDPNKNGRWPSNVVLDQKSAEKLDKQAGERISASAKYGVKDGKTSFWGSGNSDDIKYSSTGDYEGGASRFFYCSKTSKSERNAGLQDSNDIATLKPINLMRWLTRLVTPKDGVVLDPFAGSGTTGCAAVIEGFNYILIEKRERFAKEIAPKRIKYWGNSENWEDLKDHNELPDTKEMRNGSLEDFVKPEDLEEQVAKQES